MAHSRDIRLQPYYYDLVSLLVQFFLHSKKSNVAHSNVDRHIIIHFNFIMFNGVFIILANTHSN